MTHEAVTSPAILAMAHPLLRRYGYCALAACIAVSI